MGAQLKVQEVGFLRRQSHDLKKPISLITKEAEKIVRRLLELIDSTDEKIAKDACDILLKHLSSMSEQRDRDEIQRRLAHLKYGGGKTFETEEDDTPLVNFEDIQQID